MREVRLAFSLALAKAGSKIAARMAMMAMTTSNSINVNALRAQGLFFNSDFTNLVISYR